MGWVDFTVRATKVLCGFGLGFALILAGLGTVSLIGGESLSVAVGDRLLFVTLGGKLLSVVLGGLGIGLGTGVVRWAEDARREVVRGRTRSETGSRSAAEEPIR